MTVRLRGRQRRGRRAADLRAAALLRGAPARPLVPRGARHHRAHLRHLPGRVPDERDATRWRTLCGVELPEPLRELRRLLYCGEWIESHALHVYMLHAPDFLGYDGAVELGARPPDARQRGLRLKKTGNEVMRARRRPRDPSDQRPRRRLLPRADAPRAAGARRPARAGARGGARDRALDGRASTSPSARSTTSSSRSPARASTRSSDGRIVSDRGLDIAARRVRRALRRGARRALERAALAPARRRHLPLRPARPLRPQPRAALAAGARGGRRGRPRAAVPQRRSAASSSAASSSCTPATRRCG